MSSVGDTPAGSLPTGNSSPPVTPSPLSGTSNSVQGSGPLSLLNTPRGLYSGRASPGSVRRSELGSLRSSATGRSVVPSEQDGDEPFNGPQTKIWSTDVDARHIAHTFRQFFNEYNEPGDQNDTPYYHRLIKQQLELGAVSIDVDCQHVRAFSHDLYERIRSNPMEVIPIGDLAVAEIVDKLVQVEEIEAPGDRPCMIRTFNLGVEQQLRALDPNDIDKLVSVRGMVTRTSSVIPDLKMAFFECSVCNTPQQSYVENSKIEEPHVCIKQTCQAKECMRINHNRSHFHDKQIVRLQEAPEHIPEGETPQSVSMCTWEKLVDVVQPGDRVEITGIYRAASVRTNPRHRTVRALYKTYIDIVHIRKLGRGRRVQESASDNSKSDSSTIETQENDLHGAVAEREREMRELAEAPDLYDRLATALAPSVWEMNDVKKGILLQMFGATQKEVDSHEKVNGGATTKRSAINCLMVGDPGTSKSQLLQYAHKVAPRGIYTSGKGSSAVGLTAYVTRDPETREFVLESGALVLSDRGVCCIDEFDKMSEGARSILHEAMEQQTVSIAKAGIIASLNARSSVLAAANPIQSKYDPKRSVVDNINLPPSLLARFDLIYLVLDKADEITDANLAGHLVSLYRLDYQPRMADIKQRTLMQYISYARKTVDPALTDEAASMLINAYVTMRKVGANQRVVSATPRQLESLIRLSEAHARMRLSETVEAEDVEEAERLMKVSMQSAAMDPETGTIDMDLITTGRSASSRTRAQQLAESMRAMFRSMPAQSINYSDLLRELNNESGEVIQMSTLRDALSLLDRDGTVRVRPWVQQVAIGEV